MKDIYELINDVDINENEMETMEVSEFEKAKVKNHLKKKINRNKKGKKNGLIAAALCCSVIGGAGVIGVANPTYVSEIPIVGDIFRLLDNGKTGAYDKYKDYADIIGRTQESDGVKLTIKEAIFDGRTITYTYEIKSDKDLGEKPFLNTNGPRVTIKNYNGSKTGSSVIKKVDENTYVGKEDITIDKEKKYINLQLNFINMGSEEQKEVSGDWNFKINLKALDRVKQPVNKSVEKDGVKLNIEGITKTDVSFTLDYSQVSSKELQEKYFTVDTPIWEVKDDLGNVYTATSVLTNAGGEGKYDGKSMSNFGKLDSNATKLIITPKVHLSNEVYGVYGNGDGEIGEIKAIIDENHPKNGEIILDDIVIDLKK